ncbi:MAG: flavodoxin family protein [Oscillospiraceae bacterium]|nr:flavodoxin family protein [Oscillospiraceae bacterium]
MNKKILIITGSPRVDSNSDLLADSFAEGASIAGNEVKIFPAGRSRISGCAACNTCFSKSTACSYNDDFNKAAALLQWADALIIVSPMYWFTFTTQIKAVLDKMYSFIVAGKPLNIKECFLIACGETTDRSEFDGMILTYKNIAKYLKWTDRGQLIVPGVKKCSEVKNTSALIDAQNLGMDF